MALQNAINANSTTPLSTVQGGSGVSSPTAHGILVAEGGSAFNPITLTNGQLLIGSTGADPAAASLTAGTGITITPGAGTITIAATSTGETWTNVTGTSQTIAVNNGYFASNAGLVTFALPSTAALGDTFEIATGTTAGGWTISQATGQSIIDGNLTTTSGATGSLSSSDAGDSVRVVCLVANTTFQVLSSQGNLTVV